MKLFRSGEHRTLFLEVFCRTALVTFHGLSIRTQGITASAFSLANRPSTRCASFACFFEGKYLFDLLRRHVRKEGRGRGAFSLSFTFTFPRALSLAFSSHETAYDTDWFSHG